MVIEPDFCNGMGSGGTSSLQIECGYRRMAKLLHQQNGKAGVMLNFLSAFAFKVGLRECGFGITLSAIMLKSDRPSIILLTVNAGVPLASLIVVIALIVRHVILASP
jgi:hypothetical protein